MRMSCDCCGKIRECVSEFNIKAFGLFYSCSDCEREMKLNLEYETPHNFPCFAIQCNDTQGNHFIANSDLLGEMIKEEYKPGFRYGFYRDEEWKPRCRAAWLGLGNGGSMSDNDLEAEITRGLQSSGVIFLIGWRRRRLTSSSSNYPTLEIRPDIEERVDGIMTRIRDFEIKNNLVETPRLMFHSGDSFYKMKDLHEFCSSGIPKEIMMFDSVDALKEALYSRKYGRRDDVEKLVLKTSMACKIGKRTEKLQNELVLRKRKIEDVLDEHQKKKQSTQ